MLLQVAIGLATPKNFAVAAVVVGFVFAGTEKRTQNKHKLLPNSNELVSFEFGWLRFLGRARSW